jgi:hypothetical protein
MKSVRIWRLPATIEIGVEDPRCRVYLTQKVVDERQSLKEAPVKTPRKRFIAPAISPSLMPRLHEHLKTCFAVSHHLYLSPESGGTESDFEALRACFANGFHGTVAHAVESTDRGRSRE